MPVVLSSNNFRFGWIKCSNAICFDFQKCWHPHKDLAFDFRSFIFVQGRTELNGKDKNDREILRKIKTLFRRSFPKFSRIPSNLCQT